MALTGFACDDANVNLSRSVCTPPWHDRWTVWMGEAGRSGDGLQMVSRVSVGGAGRSGDGLQMVNF